MSDTINDKRSGHFSVIFEKFGTTFDDTALTDYVLSAGKPRLRMDGSTPLFADFEIVLRDDNANLVSSEIDYQINAQELGGGEFGCTLEIYDGAGEIAETYTATGCKIREVDSSVLSYDYDEPSTIAITINPAEVTHTVERMPENEDPMGSIPGINETMIGGAEVILGALKKLLDAARGAFNRP